MRIIRRFEKRVWMAGEGVLLSAEGAWRAVKRMFVWRRGRLPVTHKGHVRGLRHLPGITPGRAWGPRGRSIMVTFGRLKGRRVGGVRGAGGPGVWGVRDFGSAFFFETVIARWCNCVGLNLEGPACTGPNRLTSAIYRTKQKRCFGCDYLCAHFLSVRWTLN
jgi:hypothetical protein